MFKNSYQQMAYHYISAAYHYNWRWHDKVSWWTDAARFQSVPRIDGSQLHRHHHHHQLLRRCSHVSVAAIITIILEAELEQ